MTHIPSTSSDQVSLLSNTAYCLLIGNTDAGKNTLTERLPFPSRILLEGSISIVDFSSKDEKSTFNSDNHSALQLFQANVVMIILDASQDIPDLCRQHSQLISLLGISEVILVINKMDRVDYSERVFQNMVNSYRIIARQVGLENIAAIPISAKHNVNVFEASKLMPWYQKGALISYIQKRQAHVECKQASSGENAREANANQFESTIIWLDNKPLFPWRRYQLETASEKSLATVLSIKHQISMGTVEHLVAKKLECNAVGVCNISVDRPIAFMPYEECREMGGFVLIDQDTHNLVAIGLLHFALRRAQNIYLQQVDVNKTERTIRNGHKPAVLWFTGLSGSGKSTIANLVEKKLHVLGFHTYMLDGDNVRHGLNKDLGFTDADRVENIRRIAEVAKLMVDAGLIVLVAFISPFRSDRDRARELLEEGEFFEIFVDTPLAVAEQRDPKGLYQKARKGELKNFTGIDSPYEAPLNPEIRLDTISMLADQAAELIVTKVQSRSLGSSNL